MACAGRRRSSASRVCTRSDCRPASVLRAARPEALSSAAKMRGAGLRAGGQARGGGVPAVGRGGGAGLWPRSWRRWARAGAGCGRGRPSGRKAGGGPAGRQGAASHTRSAARAPACLRAGHVGVRPLAVAGVPQRRQLPRHRPVGVHQGAGDDGPRGAAPRPRRLPPLPHPGRVAGAGLPLQRLQCWSKWKRGGGGGEAVHRSSGGQAAGPSSHAGPLPCDSSRRLARA